jgi:hypothetical protein
MKKEILNMGTVNDVKSFLLKVGKQVYDTGKHIYYVDYNNIPRKLTRTQYE